MTDTTTVAPPLTRRQAREIERRTGHRPIATPAPVTLTAAPLAAPAPTVFDTGRIERNEHLALVSVLPTEIIERVAGPVAATTTETEAADAPRFASVRAARPLALVARSRRRTAAGLGIAASAAVLATAAVAVPGAIGDGDQAAQASLVTADGIAEAPAPESLGTEAEAVTASQSLVAAPEVATDRGEYSVASFDVEAVEEVVVTTSSVSSGAGADLSGIGAIAESMLGGGAGWLCTDFTRAVYAEAGIDLPGNVVSAQAAGGVETSDPQVGDLVVFYSGHIGIYAGGGMMWDNPGFESSVVGWQNVHRSIDVIGSGYYFVTYR